MNAEFPLRLFSASPRRVTRSPQYRFNSDSRPELGTSTIQFTFSGGGIFEHGGRRHKLESGKAFLFSVPEKSQYYFPEEAEEPWAYCWITFSGAKTWWQELRRRFGSVVTLNEEGEACRMLIEVATRYQAKRFRDTLHASEMVYRVIAALERELMSQQAADSMERAMDFIQMNFDQPWSIKEVAGHYDLSREHFIRQFTARHGASPGGLVRHLRLERARSLLSGDHLSVTEIAFQCGYSQVPSFSRAFRHKFGISPESFRQQTAHRLIQNSP